MGVAAAPIGLGLNVAQGVSSGIKGQRAARQAEQTGQQQLELVNQLTEGAFGDLDVIRGAVDQFGQSPISGAELQDMAMGAGDRIGQFAEQAAGGIGDLMGRIGSGEITAPTEFDFSAVPTTLENTIAEAQAFGNRARAGALEQAGQAFRGGGDALNAALASRGIAAGSGVAGGALADLANQGAQAITGLNRELANQAGQQALQAGQVDAQNLLAGNQMQAQYNLGFNQLAQAAQNQAFQNQLAGTQLEAGLIGQQNQFLNQGALAPYELAQNAYLQNFLQPQLATLGMLNPSSLLNLGLTGLSDLRASQEEAAATAGAGKGASMGAIPGLLENL